MTPFVAALNGRNWRCSVAEIPQRSVTAYVLGILCARRVPLLPPARAELAGGPAAAWRAPPASGRPAFRSGPGRAAMQLHVQLQGLTARAAGRAITFRPGRACRAATAVLVKILESLAP